MHKKHICNETILSPENRWGGSCISIKKATWYWLPIEPECETSWRFMFLHLSFICWFWHGQHQIVKDSDIFLYLKITQINDQVEQISVAQGQRLSLEQSSPAEPWTETASGNYISSFRIVPKCDARDNSNRILLSRFSVAWTSFVWNGYLFKKRA